MKNLKEVSEATQCLPNRDRNIQISYDTETDTLYSHFNVSCNDWVVYADKSVITIKHVYAPVSEDDIRMMVDDELAMRAYYMQVANN